MRLVPVYGDERQAGLEEAILCPRPIAIASLPRLCDPYVLDEKSLASVLKLGEGRARATNLNQPDLHYLSSLLVTSGWEMTERGVPAGWNKNDDFFEPLEVWIARRTPEDKPVNYDHSCADIIGHITDNYPVDGQGVAVSEDLAADALPDKFHLLTRSVLYKSWEKAELQERMDQLLAEVPEGKWFVSMECLFHGFDYVILESDKAKAIARNKETAFLTKHLRAYGGKGEYQGQKVGRLLRNIVFSGKGLVKKPANPDSVIFTSDDLNFAAAGYCSVSGPNQLESERTMAVELEKQLADLKAENERLQAALRDNDAKQVTDLKNKLAESETLLAKSGEALKAATEAAEAHKAQLADAEKAHKAVADELAGIKAEQKKAERLIKVKAAMKVADDDAKALAAAAKLAESLTSLNDEQFDANIQALVVASENMMTKPAPTNDPQAGNTSFPAGKAKPAPKGTPAPLAPKATDKPAPMAGKGSETDPAEANADPAVLDGTQTNQEASLATETDAGAEGIRLSIASFFGYKAEE